MSSVARVTEIIARSETRAPDEAPVGELLLHRGDRPQHAVIGAVDEAGPGGQEGRGIELVGVGV